MYESPLGPISKNLSHSQLCDDILVIKLPLNILQAPLINRIFPGARYILCLRHPLDCVLSSWMQNFELNPAMANMVDLDRAVEFYCVAVEIFELSRKRYQLNTHEIRYEDLIEDFETEASNLLSFIGLDWEPELHNFQMTAKSREAIRTPSHSQVIKPLYRNASFRWKHYEDYLDSIPLALWIKKYGYSLVVSTKPPNTTSSVRFVLANRKYRLTCHEA